MRGSTSLYSWDRFNCAPAAARAAREPLPAAWQRCVPSSMVTTIHFDRRRLRGFSSLLVMK